MSLISYDSEPTHLNRSCSSAFQCIRVCLADWLTHWLIRLLLLLFVSLSAATIADENRINFPEFDKMLQSARRSSALRAVNCIGMNAKVHTVSMRLLWIQCWKLLQIKWNEKLSHAHTHTQIDDVQSAVNSFTNSFRINVPFYYKFVCVCVYWVSCWMEHSKCAAVFSLRQREKEEKTPKTFCSNSFLPFWRCTATQRSTTGWTQLICCAVGIVSLASGSCECISEILFPKFSAIIFIKEQNKFWYSVTVMHKSVAATGVPVDFCCCYVVHVRQRLCVCVIVNIIYPYPYVKSVFV